MGVPTDWISGGTLCVCGGWVGGWGGGGALPLGANCSLVITFVLLKAMLSTDCDPEYPPIPPQLYESEELSVYLFSDMHFCPQMTQTSTSAGARGKKTRQVQA